MNKEELRKEATFTIEWECTPMLDRPTFVSGYITGALPREERIAELKEKLGDVQMQKAGEKSDLVWKLKTANEQKAEQLTEAKGIINNCVHELQIILLHKIRNKERIAIILDKTEQFLKEVSE